MRWNFGRWVLATVVMGMICLPVMAAPPLGGKPGGKPGAGKKGKGGPPTTAMMASRMIQSFDRNGDNALNAQELAAALTAMRENRGGSKGKGAGKGPAGKGAGKKPAGAAGKPNK